MPQRYTTRTRAPTSTHYQAIVRFNDVYVNGQWAGFLLRVGVCTGNAAILDDRVVVGNGAMPFDTCKWARR